MASNVVAQPFDSSSSAGAGLESSTHSLLRSGEAEALTRPGGARPSVAGVEQSPPEVEPRQGSAADMGAHPYQTILGALARTLARNSKKASKGCSLARNPRKAS